MEGSDELVRWATNLLFSSKFRCQTTLPDTDEEIISSPTSKIVRNLRYTLDQLRVVGDEASYMDLVEKLVIGPAPLRATHVEQLLGVNPDLFTRASTRRQKLVRAGLRPSWGEEGEVLRSRPRTSCSPERRLPSLSRAPEVNSPRPMRWKFPNLHHQFLLFAKFGETCSDGSQITLTQSDKWLKQAKVVDGWNVTTTDTAIAFRKISRGSIWLAYNPWRQFLEELATRKGLDMKEMVDRLEMCGKPGLNKVTKYTANQMFDPEEF